MAGTMNGTDDDKTLAVERFPDQLRRDLHLMAALERTTIRQLVIDAAQARVNAWRAEAAARAEVDAALRTREGGR